MAAPFFAMWRLPEQGKDIRDRHHVSELSLAFGVRTRESHHQGLRTKLWQLGDVCRDPPRPISIARDVSWVCKGVPEMVPAMGSRCKSRDQPTRSDSTLRMYGIGSPSTLLLFGRLPRTRGRRQKLG